MKKALVMNCELEVYIAIVPEQAQLVFGDLVEIEDHEYYHVLAVIDGMTEDDYKTCKAMLMQDKDAYIQRNFREVL